MRKIDIIEDCEDCSHRWFYLENDVCCLLRDKKRVPIECEGIPNWCPLPDAPHVEEIEELKNHIN